METSQELVQLLNRMTQPGFRHRLRARGLARSMMLKDGQLLPGSPIFAMTLTNDLIDFGFTLLHLALRGRELKVDNNLLRKSFEIAAECIEGVIRNNALCPEHGFFRICAAAAYHLAGYCARAFSLIQNYFYNSNFSSCEKILALLIMRRLDELQIFIREWLKNNEHSDEFVSKNLFNEENPFGIDDALAIASTSFFSRSIAIFEQALKVGNKHIAQQAINMLQTGIHITENRNMVVFWWIFSISRHLLEDLWNSSLHECLPLYVLSTSIDRWSYLRELFIDVLYNRSRAEIELWPSQFEAVRRAVDISDDLVITLPTSAGKTRIAEICVLRVLAEGKRAIIVTPLRALSAQTERSFREVFHPLGFSVSALYGAAGTIGKDLDTLKNCHIVVTTPEKLDFALRNDELILNDIGTVIFDEAHLIGPDEREIRYEVLVQRLLRRADSENRRIICLSAILPSGEDLDDFVGWIRRDKEGAAVQSNWRPTRQRFGEIVWHEHYAQLDLQVEDEQAYIQNFVTQIRIQRKKFPNNKKELVIASAWKIASEGQRVLIFCAERRSVEPLAKCVIELFDKKIIASLLKLEANEEELLKRVEYIGSEWLGKDHPAVKCLRIGIAVHHGQLPNIFLREIETLIQSKILKVIIASPTLSQGLNLSASTLLVPSISRNRKRISGEEFSNVCGRAGRAYVDIEGQILNINWELDPGKRKYKRYVWRQLVYETKYRKIESGLFQLIQIIIENMAKAVDLTRTDIIEYLTNSQDGWELNINPTENTLNSEEFFSEKIACLDTTILSLIDSLDCSKEELPLLLDQALEQSLWKRRLLRLTVREQQIQRAILLGRAGFIWSQTSGAQRKGYFCAGIGLKTGRYLDQYEEQLKNLLLNSENLLLKNDLENFINSMKIFAEIIFQIYPFIPSKKIPEHWKEIFTLWISGETVEKIIKLYGEGAINFIEDGLTYRLVWALEVIRVRGIASDAASEKIFKGYCASVIETGSSSLAASLLMRAGFTSRIAANKVILETQANFTKFEVLQFWLLTDRVEQFTKKLDWPTKETASEWQLFRYSQINEGQQNWSEHQFIMDVIWKINPLSLEPCLLRIFHDDKVHHTLICTSDFQEVGYLKKPFSFKPKGVLNINVIDPQGKLHITYRGPDKNFSDS